MKSMKKLVLAALILLASVVVLAGCDTQLEPEPEQTTGNEQSGGSENDSVPEVPKYTVTFDTDGGSAVDSQSVESGKMAIKPSDPTLEGSWFLGWYGDKERTKEFDFSIPITDNTKVYAKWSYKLHSIPQILTDYSRPNNTDSKWTYVAFGDWPQTIKAKGVIVDETKSRQMGMFTYYLGRDGNYYVKVTANPYVGGYTYSDESEVTKDTEVYFKVEPIVWRVLTEDYTVPGENGEPQSTKKALLLAEKILTGGIKWADSKNNYRESNIRKWLNGNSSSGKDDNYSGDAGFLQTAFTETARDQIAETKVDNSVTSTLPNELTDDQKSTYWYSGVNEYTCENTIDKIFLLSEQEATMEDYGFAEYNVYVGDRNKTETSTRIRVTTDYAKATGAYQSATAGYGGWWWLRSPYYRNEDGTRFIYSDGDANYYDVVDNTCGGVVPALSISINGN